jgi:hypothetical protein
LVTYVLAFSHLFDDGRLRNIQFFLEHGVHDCPHIVYALVINGDENATLPKVLRIPRNVHLLRRPNQCHDSGGYAAALTWAQDKFKHLAYFIFLNASVRGPFLATHTRHLNWVSLVTNLFEDEGGAGAGSKGGASTDRLSEAPPDRAAKSGVHFIGSTVNCWSHPKLAHVQTMMFALDQVGLERVRAVYFDRCATQVLPHLTHEVPLTASYLHDGFRAITLRDMPPGRNDREVWRFWNHAGFGKPATTADARARDARLQRAAFGAPSGLRATPLTLAHAGLDLASLTPSQCNYDSGDAGDPYIPKGGGHDHGAYFGVDLSPLEVMFIKTNRGYRKVQMDTIDRYSEWADRERARLIKIRCGKGRS